MDVLTCGLALRRDTDLEFVSLQCDVFINVSCAQTALLDSKEFLAPIITPFEAILALDRYYFN